MTRQDQFAEEAIANVAYYRDRFSGLRRLQDLPPLEREDVVAHRDELVHDRADRSRLLESRTSGSTGAPVVTYQSPQDRMLAAMTLWRGRRWHGVRSPDVASCRFYGYRPGEEIGHFSRIHRKGPELLFSWFDLSPEALGEYASAMHSHRPGWLHGSPSVLSVLARHLLDEQIPAPPDLRLIELTGEVGLDDDLTVIKQAFPEVSVAQQYGTRETWCIAYGCPEGTLHVMEDSVAVRWLVDPNLPGSQPLVTPLRFGAMPLLNYRLSDRVRLGVSCACGRSSQTIATVDGRTSDFAVKQDGTPVAPQLFHVLVSAVNEQLGAGIGRFRVTQLLDGFDVELEPTSGWTSAHAQQVKSQIRAVFPDQEVRLQLGAIDMDTGRKFRAFEQRGLSRG